MSKPALAGVHEIAELLSVSRQRVHQIIRNDPGFPSPVAELASGEIWDLKAVQKWKKKVRPSTEGQHMKIVMPQRDPERPQDDPYDANAIRHLMKTPEGSLWTRGNLTECLRRQPRRVERQPQKVAEAEQLAAKYDVIVRRDPGGKTLHFFRTDSDAPAYPKSASERRAWLRRDNE